MSTIYGRTEFGSPAFVQGFTLSSNTATVSTYTAGSARAVTSDFVMEYNGFLPGLPATLSVDLTVNGAGGCWPVPMATAKPASNMNFFPVYLVANSAGTTGGSLSNVVAPALVIATASTGFVPEGYDSYQLIDYVLVNSTPNFISRQVTGHYNSRDVMFNSRINLVIAGNATAAAALPINGVFTQITNIPNLTKMRLLTSYTPATAGNDLDIYPGLGSYYTDAPIVFTGPVISVQVINPVEVPAFLNASGVPTVSYNVAASGDSVNIYCVGYSFDIPFPSAV